MLFWSQTVIFGYLTSCFDFLFYNMINGEGWLSMRRVAASVKGSQMSNHITATRVDETLGAIPLIGKEEHRYCFRFLESFPTYAWFLFTRKPPLSILI